MKRVFIVFIFFIPVLFSQAQQRVITGFIKDDITKKAIEGCSILEENTKNGTITNKSGGFTINLNHSNDTINLSIKNIGYDTDTLKVLPHKTTTFFI